MRYGHDEADPSHFAYFRIVRIVTFSYGGFMHLRHFKLENRLTLTALTRRLGRPVSTVHGWFNGTRRPDRTSIEDIMRATNGAVTANDFQSGLAETQAPFAIEARSLGLDPSAIAARAIRKTVGAEKALRWTGENREAIAAHNHYVEEHGLPLEKYRMF